MKKLFQLGLAALSLAVTAPLAKAWTYTNEDALLIFRKTGGVTNVEFNLGNISQFTNKPNGYIAIVTNWDISLVNQSFGSLSATDLKVAVVATTSKDLVNVSDKHVWLSSADSGTPANRTPSQWQNLWSKVDATGTKPVSASAGSFVTPTTAQAAYDYINSSGGLTPSAIPTLGGASSFVVEQGLPVGLKFWQITPSAAAVEVGKFTLNADGLLYFTVGTVAAPSVTNQPASQTVAANSSVTVSAGVAGGALFYQWQLNGTNIPGATASSYTIASASLADAGAYSVVVTNLAGSTVSSNADLTVVAAPEITVQPQPATQTVWQGTNVSFNVSASNAIAGVGSNPAYGYQWQLNGTNIPGATASSYTIPSVQAADVGDYTVVVSNLAGSITSSNATLAIIADNTLPTVVITSPAAFAKFKGTNGVSVTVTGTAADDTLVKSVKYSLNGGAFQDATGTTSWSVANPAFIAGTNTFTVKSVDLAGNESATVTRSFIYSPFATLTVAITGSGTVTPSLSGQDLIVGKAYKFTATPGAGYLFSNWVVEVNGTTNVVSTATKYTFTPTINPAKLIANFVPNQFLARAGTYNGLFSETNGATVESAGFASIKLTAKDGKAAAFTAKLYLAGEKVSAAGVFDVAGAGSNTKPVVFKATTNTLTVRLHLPFDSSDTLTGSISNNQTGWVAELISDRALINAGFAGAHTLVIPGTSNGPAGDGFGSVTIDASGVAAITGNLGDGQALKQKVAVSKNGDWPFFATANKTTVGGVPVNAGVILGWLNVSNTTPAGTVQWVKNAVGADTYYPAGFSTATAVESSGYTNLSPVITLVNGSATLAGGNLPSALSNSIALSLANVFTASTNYSLKLTVVPATGLLKGTFKNPANGNAVTKIGGVVLQNANTGRGNFPGANQYGSLLIQSN